jgi:uncharacterized membrane protein YidH (DUF202 family)
MPQPINPHRHREIIQLILVWTGIFLSLVGWLRWARLA